MHLTALHWSVIQITRGWGTNLVDSYFRSF